MPKLIEEAEIRLNWSDIANRVRRPKPKHVERRSSGVHLKSGIIEPVLRSSGLLTKIDEEDLDKSNMPIAVAVGLAWEDWVVGLWPLMKCWPGEISLDGVIGTPDGRTKNTLEEIKCTWCSRRTYGADITQSRAWMWQLAGYLKMMKLVRTRLHVLWACGDYKQGPPSPAYHTYLLEFSQMELDRFWVNVVLPNRERAPREEHGE